MTDRQGNHGVLNMAEDITNRVVRNIFSVEFLGMLVLAGIAYGAMSSDVNTVTNAVHRHNASHSADIADIRKTESGLVEDIGDIKSDVEVIKNSQSHFKDALQRTSQHQQRLQDGQSLILDQLRRMQADD